MEGGTVVQLAQHPSATGPHAGTWPESLSGLHASLFPQTLSGCPISLLEMSFETASYTHFGARSRGLHLRYTRLRTSSYENARGFTTDLGPAFGQVGLVPIASGLTDWGTMTNFMDPSLCLQSQGLGFTGREQRPVRPATLTCV